MPGPRGLIRVGVWDATTAQPELVNFIAVEPVVEGTGSRHTRMAFSELEPSVLDAPQRGKRLWVAGKVSGEISLLSPPGVPNAPVECLTVRIEVEPFTANRAHVYLLAQMRSDRPDEVAFRVFHHDDSAPIEENTLTATMGNYERLRLLHLKDGVVDSRVLYAGYAGVDFAERESYPLEALMRAEDGSVFVACTSDEPNPSATVVEHPWWKYKSIKLTQYWRVPAEDVQPNLRVRVNGRRVYWGSKTLEIPGGIAFENFEIRQRYVAGQTFTFGLSRKEPHTLIENPSSLPPCSRRKRMAP